MYLNEHFIKSALSEVTLNGSVPPDVSFSIDSRTLERGNIFIALEGIRYDGHAFIEEVLKKGAAGIMIAQSKQQVLNKIDKKLLSQILVIIVPHTKNALLQLATAWRNQFSYPVIAITGSVGKTTTKTMISTILSLHGIRHIASQGTQNTFIGLALNMLKMRAEHEVAIFEIGIDRRSEMIQKSAMLRPTNALITGIGHAHMEGIGSVIDIATEKRAIFSHFQENNVGIVNGDQALLANISYRHPIIKFGLKTTNQIQARKVTVNDNGSTSFTLKLYGQKYKVTLPTHHSGAVYNALAATTIAHVLQVPIATIIAGIEQLVTIVGRYEQRSIKHGKGIIINDCYNANPESMKAALLALERIETQAQKIAIIGDMLELGANSSYWHRQIGRFLRKVPSLRSVILVGTMVQELKKTLPVNVTAEIVPSWQAAVPLIKDKLMQESLVLVKGSRSMQLNNLVDELAPL